MKKHVLMLLIVAPFSYGADYNKGRNCLLEKDYSCALAEFKPLAGQGHMNAQYNLGVM